MKDPGRTARRQHPKFIVGWREWVALPDLDVTAIKAKFDTGARTSTLHAWDVERFRRARADWVRFRVHPIQRRTEPELACTARLVEMRRVTSSVGHTELRPVIETTLACWQETWQIELTLTNRDNMGFRMLLGRTGMAGRLLVDPRLSFQLGKPPRHVAGAPPSRTRYRT